ncbi:phage tail tape measure protein [Streptomyces sp. CB02959]|uniref:phage tail tape measure protein n=1 Tax=Streptomyces sp. CB02959 TaxID=2020330 RepID=UPI0021530CAC|nr:phage tail tape measure protein [Streptomyces sp. CB02959]
MVGELAATITVDDSGARQGVARARAAMQAGGDQMAAAGDRAGRQAGDGIGRGVADGAAEGGSRAGGRLAESLKGKFAAAAVGAAIGGALVAALGSALEQSQIAGQLRAQLGATAPAAAQYGKAAGALYSGAIVESVQDGAEVIKGIARNGLLPPEATQAQIQTMGRRVADTAAVMGEDVSKVSRAVGVMLKTGIARSADEAMDVLVKGSQSGVDAAEDLLDTFSEYPTEFRQLGLDAQTSMGLLQQGLQGGARDADVVADALKEFTLQAQGMNKATTQAYADLGFSGEKMQATFQKGGPAAAAAFEQVITKLRGVQSPAKQAEIALGLFGPKFEDMQKAIFALDPAHAVDALGKVKGATDAAGNSMRDNAATKLEIFKRTLTQSVVNVLGTYVVPALTTAAQWVGTLGAAFSTAGSFIAQHSTTLSIVAGVITTLMLPALIQLAVQATTSATAAVVGWARQGAAAITGAAQFVASNATVLAGWIAQGAGAAAAAGRVVASWIAMGAQALIQGARMAAAWIMAMGPVALVIAAVVGIVALIVTNWDKIKSATAAVWEWIWNKIKSVGQFLVDLFMNFTLVGIIIKHWDSIKSGTARVWNAIVDWVKGIPQKIVNFFLNWTLVGLIIKHWDSIKTGTVRKAGELVDWVRGFPGRIASGIGNLGHLLYDKGMDIIRGLWNGIKGMGPWLVSKLMSWAKDMIPGPIARALGIHSPSRLMRDKIGKFIPAGLVAGIEAGAPAVDRTMRNLVSVPAGPQFATAGGAPSPWSPAAPGPAVHIENWHAGAATADQTAAALAWQMKGRG